MSILKKLGALLLGCFTIASTLLTASSIEVPAGLMPFTLYYEGNVHFYYDEHSRPSQISYVDPQGKQYATQEFSYDNHGFISCKNLTERRGFWCTRISKFSYVYTQTNQIYSESQSYGFNSRQLSYHYNLFGNVDNIQAREGYLFSSKREKVSYRYSKDGKLEARTYYSKSGDVALHHEFSYDPQGRPIEKWIFDGNLNLVSHIYFDYSVATSLDSVLVWDVDIETNYDAKGNIISLVYCYRDDQGLLFERSLRDADGNLIALTKYEYNGANQLERLTDIDSLGHTLGSVTTFYDTIGRPYLHEFSYSDKNLLAERVKPLLCLPGIDL